MFMVVDTLSYFLRLRKAGLEEPAAREIAKLLGELQVMTALAKEERESFLAPSCPDQPKRGLKRFFFPS